jgi:hypothetical protein
VKWETGWPQPKLLHIQTMADLELCGITADNYGKFVLDKAQWEEKYGISAETLERAEMPPMVWTGG